MTAPTGHIASNRATNATHRSGRNAAAFWISLSLLLVLPIAPEFALWRHGYDDLKAFASIAYYELIFSFMLWLPALFFPRGLRVGWTVAVAALTLVATLIVGHQAISIGARWDATAHGALLETNLYEAKGFVAAFLDARTVVALAILIAAFVGATVANVLTTPPRRSVSAAVAGAAIVFSGWGIHNIIVYGGNPTHVTMLSDDTSVRLIESSPNSYHPILRLATTHWNYVAMHEYRLKVLREMNRHLGELAGATVVPHALPPRVIVLVIGESASRRHWGLYGYQRQTTPELAALSGELLVYRDAICRTVGTTNEIQGMLCSSKESLPMLGLFAAAGYKTHWLSAQMDQGPNDAKLSALVQGCAERRFLNGAHDENLVPLLERAVAEPGRQFIVLNLFGSHVRYDDRYPRAFAFYHGDGEKAHRLAAYDNSIRYTDHVLARMISVLRDRREPISFLYLSDHAEDVYDSNPDQYLFRSDSVSTDAMYEIPMVLWLSPEYRQGNPGIVSAAERNEPRPIQSLGLYQTLIDLARLRHPLFDAERSFVSSEYRSLDRHVGVAQRVYHPNPGK